MAKRTGTIDQEQRASRDHQKSIDDIRKEIISKRNEIKKLIFLLNTLIPSTNLEQQKANFPSTWDYLKRMSKDAISKVTKDSPPFVRPTRSRVRSYAQSGGEQITQQHMKEDCDINVIIKRHAETGNISHLNPATPLYIDCTGIGDLQGAIHLVEEAENNFATLPSAVRKACQNDPVEFIEMLYTEEGTAELAAAGLEYGPKPDPDTGTVIPTPKPKTTPPQVIDKPAAHGAESPTPENPPASEASG